MECSAWITQESGMLLKVLVELGFGHLFRFIRKRLVAMHPDKCFFCRCCRGPTAGTDLIPASSPGTWADFLKIFVPRHCWGKLLCTEKGRAAQVVIQPGSA